jgi:hypothetical protein
MLRETGIGTGPDAFSGPRPSERCVKTILTSPVVKVTLTAWQTPGIPYQAPRG